MTTYSSAATLRSALVSSIGQSSLAKVVEGRSSLLHSSNGNVSSTINLRQQPYQTYKLYQLVVNTDMYLIHSK